MNSKLKSFLQKSTNKLGYKIIPVKQGFPKDMDPNFKRIYTQCKDFTMTPIERMYALYKSVQYVIQANIEGDFVECGAWKGGSSMIIALTLLELGVTDRNIYIYDTYEGMAKPTEQDKNIVSESSALDKWNSLQQDNHNAWCYSSLEEVKKNMLSTNYPAENIIFVKGKVEETIPNTIPEKVSLLRLDTDWYESTKHELLHLYPLLLNQGVLLIDDYGCWAGSKKAVDEYLQKNQIAILLQRTDADGGRISIKTTTKNEHKTTISQGI